MTAFVYRPDHPLANENGMVDRDIAPPRNVDTKSIYIIPDIKEYRSIVSNKVIDGRRDRREDLKRNQCREVDPSEFTPVARTAKWAKRLNVPHDPQHVRDQYEKRIPSVNLDLRRWKG